jgi:glutathione synthase/RimK-type ligase-like ATP-grasp enzyme
LFLCVIANLSKKPLLCQFIDDVKDIPNRESTDVKHFLIEKLKLLTEQENFRDKQILMLTRKMDPEADLLAIKLLQRGIDYNRLNIDDIPVNITIRYRIQQDLNLKIEITVGGRIIDPLNVPLVLLRNFDIRSINFNVSDLVREFSFQQWDHAYRTLQSNLKCEWINSPGSTIQANDRVEQLSIAKSLGFNIPSTLITNDPIEAHNFYNACHGNIVLKALHHHVIEINNKVFYMYTHTVQKRDLSIFNDLVYAPSILQQRLDKRSELRITVVGEKVFAVEIDSQSNAKGRDDMHRCQLSDLPKREINLENKIRNRCVKLTNILGLKYAAIDLVVSKDDHLYFLEVNPTGDWLWIESETGIQITDALVDLIEGFYTTCD